MPFHNLGTIQTPYIMPMRSVVLFLALAHAAQLADALVINARMPRPAPMVQRAPARTSPVVLSGGGEENKVGGPVGALLGLGFTAFSFAL